MTFIKKIKYKYIVKSNFDPYETASQWHGGMFTELYKLSSSGKIDSKKDLIDEIKDAIKEVEKKPDNYDDDEINRLIDLLSWVEDEFEGEKELDD